MNFKIEKKQCCGAGLDRNRTIVDAGSNPVLFIRTRTVFDRYNYSFTVPVIALKYVKKPNKIFTKKPYV